MAPMSMTQTLSVKRTSSDAGFDAPRMNQQRQHYFRHHQLRHKQLVDGAPGHANQNDATAQEQLSRSILLALKAVGFESADPIALESFRAVVEEYMKRLFSGVRDSMLSSRRTRTIPQDFLHTLKSQRLTLRALLPHLDPPVSPSKSQPPLTRDLTEDEDPKNAQLINTMLNGASDRMTSTYVPSHFPALPSQHTYKAKAVFTHRDRDPRALRERATEESRLGEEALRKLVGVGTGGRSASGAYPLHSGKRIQNPRERADDIWKQTMRAVMSEGRDQSELHGGIHDPGGMGENSLSDGDFSFDNIGPPVNANSIYWRKPIPSRPHRDSLNS